MYTGVGQFFITVYMNAFSTHIGFLNGFSTCSLVILRTTKMYRKSRINFSFSSMNILYFSLITTSYYTLTKHWCPECQWRCHICTTETEYLCSNLHWWVTLLALARMPPKREQVLQSNTELQKVTSHCLWMLKQLGSADIKKWPLSN